MKLSRRARRSPPLHPCALVLLESLEGRRLLHGGAFEAMVNFQPARSAVPVGYVADAGAVFSDRGNGFAYGWDLPTVYARDRNSAASADQRYDTLNHMQKPGGGGAWEIEVPNGTYSVRVVAGDPAAYDSNYAIEVEGILTVSGRPTLSNRWFEGTKSVTVADGRLTVSNAVSSVNNKLCFIDIHQEVSAALPAVSVTASDPSAAEAGRDPGSFIVSRRGDTTEALSVLYTLDGKAIAGVDFASRRGSVTIPAGALSASVTIDPIDDAAVEDSEEVVLSLSASPAYEIAAPAGATVVIADNDTPAAGFAARVNFQPRSAPVPAGYVADTGAVFGDRGDGLFFGWNVSNASLVRDRNAPISPDQRYDTLTHTQAGGATVWEIIVPDGVYSVRIVAGDPSAYNSTYAIAAEGVTVVSGKPTSTRKWLEGTASIRVTDGRLTLTNAAGAANNKINFIDIASEGTGPALPVVTVAAADASAAEAGGNPGEFTVSRSGPTDEPLVVNLAIGGNATNGRDYAALGASITIPAGEARVALAVRPADDSLVEGSESVMLAVAAGAGYTAGSTAPAIVSIADNDSPAGTALSWAAVAPTTVGRSEGMGAVVNGKLYLFGGYIDKTFKPTSRGDVYDPAANRWTQIAGLPFGVSHMGTAAVGDSIYFAGGYPATRTGQSFTTNAVWRYDIQTNAFATDLPKLPSARGGGALVALGRALHFFGGSDAARKDAAQHWRLDLDQLGAGWVVKAPLPLATNHIAGAVVGGKIYAIGGQQNQDRAAVQRADVQVYDPATDAWTSRTPLPLARSHTTSSTFVRDGQIIVLGGLGPGNRVINRVDRYDPDTNAWAALTPLPGGRLSGVADVLGDGRIVFSTGSMTRTTWIGTFA